MVLSCFQRLNQSDPINRERESRPISIQRPKRWFQILLNCVKLNFVSCTSSYWNKCITSKNAHCSTRSRFRVKISRKIGVLKQSQPALFCKYYPHNITVKVQMCDECKISSDLCVCHKLWSILWSIVQICSLTIENQVFQYVPSTNISEKLRAYFWQFCCRFQFFLFKVVVIDAWSRYFVELLSRPVC